MIYLNRDRDTFHTHLSNKPSPVLAEETVFSAIHNLSDLVSPDILVCHLVVHIHRPLFPPSYGLFFLMGRLVEARHGVVLVFGFGRRRGVVVVGRVHPDRRQRGGHPGEVQATVNAREFFSMEGVVELLGSLAVLEGDVSDGRRGVDGFELAEVLGTSLATGKVDGI